MPKSSFNEGEQAVEPISTNIILKALDGLSARATVTAQNIANANSPGYRPLKVSFEEALRRAATSGVEAIRAVEPRISAAGDSDLRLDLELATATSTSGRYQTLAELLSRQLQIDAVALSSGGR